MRSTKPILMAALAGMTVLAVTGCTVWRIGQSAELARQSEPLQVRPAAPALRLLVVGDSTAVGTGASTPAHSLAGLLAARFPGLLIENRARDGATFADVAAQLAGAERFDMVLVQAGGNDVIRLRDLDQVAQDIDHVTTLARQVADLVVLMPAGNVGNAPFFLPPMSWWMTQRARRLHAAVAATAARHGAVYVRLFQERADDPFARQRALNASDGLHPSDAGYRVWMQQLMQQAGLAGRLTAAAPA
jgi:lysophospholipase L1-like esterase